MPIANQLVTKNKLASLVMRVSEKRGLRMDTRCKSQIERHISLAVERILLLKLSSCPDKKMLAEGNLILLIECMEKHAKSIGTFPSLGVAVFTQAKRELSPLWPYF